jgi:hypothetical protein
VKTKTAYRPKNIPAETPEPPQPSETIRVEFTNNEIDPSIGIVGADEIPNPDEASEALKRQINALQQSEELQRQYATQARQQRPPSREEKLSAWRAQGAEESELGFLAQNPELIDRPDVTSQAAAAALHAGLQRGTDEFNNAVKVNFDRLMGRTEAQPAQPASTPAFFAPEPSQRSPAPDRAAMYSAPVSRTASPGSPRERSPAQVWLTPAEIEMARIAGISEVEYARQRQRLEREKRDGTRQ